MNWKIAREQVRSSLFHMSFTWPALRTGGEAGALVRELYLESTLMTYGFATCS